MIARAHKRGGVVSWLAARLPSLCRSSATHGAAGANHSNWNRQQVRLVSNRDGLMSVTSIDMAECEHAHGFVIAATAVGY